jgi:hypothetical protein
MYRKTFRTNWFLKVCIRNLIYIKMFKSCSKCLLELHIDMFSKSKKGLLGRCSICKSCRNKEAVIYRDINSDRISSNKKIHYQKNKVKINEKKRIWCNDKYKNDESYKLKVVSRNIVRRFIKQKGTKHTEDILGCSYDEFKTYLESKFEDWMNWDNYGLYNGELNYGWDIDHIIPLSSNIDTNLSHYTNLQPLCSKMNRDIKRDIYPTHH